MATFKQQLEEKKANRRFKIAMSLTLAVIFYYLLVTFINVPDNNKETVYLILGNLTGAGMMAWGFYFSANDDNKEVEEGG